MELRTYLCVRHGHDWYCYDNDVLGYRVTFAEQEPDTRNKIEPLQFNAITVFAQFFKIRNSSIADVL